MKIINPLENYTKDENDVVCFLGGAFSSSNKWRNDVILFLENIEKDKTLSLDKLVIINPFRKDWNTKNPSDEDLNNEIKWEIKMQNDSDIFVSYFDKNDKDNLPLSLFELGNNMINIKVKFGNNKINYRILPYAHPDYQFFNDLKFQLEALTERWKTPITLESTEKNITSLASKILESYVKVSK